MRRRAWSWIAVLLALAMSESALAPEQAEPPYRDPQLRQLDFWRGDSEPTWKIHYRRAEPE